MMFLLKLRQNDCSVSFQILGRLHQRLFFFVYAGVGLTPCPCWLGGLHLFQVKHPPPPPWEKKKHFVFSPPSSICLLLPTHLSMKDTVLPQGIVCLAVVPATAIWVQGGKGDPTPFELLPSQPACTFFNNFP